MYLWLCLQSLLPLLRLQLSRLPCPRPWKCSLSLPYPSSAASMTKSCKSRVFRARLVKPTCSTSWYSRSTRTTVGMILMLLLRWTLLPSWVTPQSLILLPHRLLILLRPIRSLRMTWRKHWRMSGLVLKLKDKISQSSWISLTWVALITTVPARLWKSAVDCSPLASRARLRAQTTARLARTLPKTASSSMEQWKTALFAATFVTQTQTTKRKLVSVHTSRSVVSPNQRRKPGYLNSLVLL